MSYNWPRIYMKKSWLSNILNTNVEVLWFFDFEGWKFEKKFQGWAIKLSIKPTYVKYSRFQEFITRVSTGVKLSFWFLIAYFRLDRWRPYQPPLLVSPEKIRCPLPMNEWPGHHKNESEIQINWENCRFWWIRGTWINQMLMKKNLSLGAKLWPSSLEED